MNKRKYPFSMFIMGTILNLFKMWPCFILVVILGIISWFNPAISNSSSIVLVGALVLIAIIQQLKTRSILLSDSDNEKTNELFDKMFADNSKGYKNVTDTVDEIIRNQMKDSEE